MSDKIRFAIVDPRGRTIICTEDTWRWHILDFHPNMEPHEADVKLAIESPQWGIFADVDEENRHIYYLTFPRQPYYLKVVVEFDENDNGEVITAFRSDTLKTGEKLIWPTSED
jgi:hypothetical protein